MPDCHSISLHWTAQWGTYDVTLINIILEYIASGPLQYIHVVDCSLHVVSQGSTLLNTDAKVHSTDKRNKER